VANDVDILILPRQGWGKEEQLGVLCDAVVDLSEELYLPEHKLDVILFSLQKIDLEVLYDAVDKGILLVKKDAEYLTDMFEMLSSKLRETEGIGRRNKQELMEMLGIESEPKS
jgi:hypothetical protein